MKKVNLPNPWYSSSTANPDWQLKEVIQKLNRCELFVPDREAVRNDLYHSKNPWASYQPIELKESPFDSNLNAHIGNATLDLLRKRLVTPPHLGLEVGSFIGASAILLGNWISHFDGMLICVDTWCGDINMWLHERFKDVMNKTDGNPELFHHFMKNVSNANLEETVFPLRLTSIAAARLLNTVKYSIDFVYLDSAHEYGETYLELSVYWDLLRPGGVLFGDDYLTFPAIKHDVELFVENNNIKSIEFPESTKDTFLLTKAK